MGPIEAAADALVKGAEKIRERSIIQTYVNPGAELRHERQQTGITWRQQRKYRRLRRTIQKKKYVIGVDIAKETKLHTMSVSEIGRYPDEV